MKIVVCIKQVPGTTAVEVDEKSGVLKRDGVESKMNPYDLYAIEQALLLKEQYGGTVDVISMGPGQAQVLNLIKRINKESNTSILFISHDLGVINRLCDRVIVMYAGKIVEMGATSDILSDPIHEYTKGLIHSIPTRKQKGTDLKCIKGKVPSVTEEKPACPFAARCEKAIDLCYAKAPSELQWSDGHVVWCHKVNVGS